MEQACYCWRWFAGKECAQGWGHSTAGVYQLFGRNKKVSHLEFQYVASIFSNRSTCTRPRGMSTTRLVHMVYFRSAKCRTFFFLFFRLIGLNRYLFKIASTSPVRRLVRQVCCRIFNWTLGMKTKFDPGIYIEPNGFLNQSKFWSKHTNRPMFNLPECSKANQAHLLSNRKYWLV